MQTEKEKMLAGKPYLSSDTALVNERMIAKDLAFDYNNTRPSDFEKRRSIIKKIFGKTGERFSIEQPFHCDYGYNIEVGEDFFANYNCVILDCAKVTIGNNVMLAPNVAIYTVGHPLHYEPRNKEIEYAFPVTIGNNVWIGGNVVINAGVTIGENTVIGSGSIVTKDIPANVVAVGNPCKVVRQITEEDKLYYFRKLAF